MGVCKLTLDANVDVILGLVDLTSVFVGLGEGVCIRYVSSRIPTSSAMI